MITIIATVVGMAGVGGAIALAVLAPGAAAIVMKAIASALASILNTRAGACAAAALVGIAIGYAWGHSIADQASEVETYKARAAALQGQVMTLEARIKARDDAARADTETAVADAIERTNLEKVISDATLAATDRQCLDHAATERVRAFWPEPDGKPRRSAPAAR